MDDELYNLVYVSAAVREMSEPDLVELLEQARDKNARLDVTGMLLYCQGSFMQALEGPRQAVKDLYDEIRRDPRHRLVTTLIEGPIAHRSFPRWTMGFDAIDDREVERRTGYTRFLWEGAESQDVSEMSSLASQLLLSFRETSCP